jgi:hypothetical protein
VTELALSESAVAVVIDDVRRFGGRRLETGGFFLASVDEPTEMTGVALAGAAGIRRRRDLFSVSGLALDRLFTWANEAELRIPVQFHSHGGRAFLSPVDLRHGMSVRGFTSCIVPFSADPPCDPAQWGWFRFDGRAWTKADPPRAVSTKAVRVVTFDEDGVE